MTIFKFHFVYVKTVIHISLKQTNEIKYRSSLLAGGYWGFHRGKPVPFGNRAPSWIFEARAPGYVFHPSPRPPPLAHFINSLPGPDLAAQIQDGDLITNSGSDHPTACVQASIDPKLSNIATYDGVMLRSKMLSY